MEPQPRPSLAGVSLVEGDYTSPVLENMHLPLFDVWRASLAAGERVIRGKTFQGCLIEGPAVLHPVERCIFDRCHFGETEDVRSLLLRPEGPAVTGAIPVADSRFQDCTFLSIGFTGDPDFLEALRHLTPRMVS